MTARPLLSASAGQTLLRRRIVALVWWGGFVLLGLIALTAAVRAGQVLAGTWGIGVDRAGLLWLGVAVALGVAALVGLIAVVMTASRGRELVAAALGVLALVSTRLIAIAVLPTPLRTDWADYQHQAMNLAAGGAFESARPPGWPFVLSLLYRVTGPNPVVGELFDLACALAVGLLVYLLARRSFGSVAAAAALFLWAISPGPALFTVVLASEHLYTLTFIGTVSLAVLALRRSWLAWVPVGILLALGQYVRPVGLVIVPAFVVLPFLVGLPRRQATAAVVTILVAFGLVIGPSVAWQYQRFGRLTLSTSNYDGFNLLVGLNVAHRGKYNLDDVALVGASPETVEFRDRSYRLALQRLTSNPAAVAVLLVPKFRAMWGESTYGPFWAMTADRRGQPRAAATMTLLSQCGYAIVVALAAVFLWVRRRERDPVILLIVLCLGAVAVSEVFLEVQSRYHSFFEPLFCLLAGGTVGWLADRWRRRAGRLAMPESAIREAVNPDPAESAWTAVESRDHGREPEALARYGAFDKTENRGILLLL